MITLTPWTTELPAPGWHFASAERNPEWLRFWDGTAWSIAVHEAAPDDELARCRATVDTTLGATRVWWRTLTADSLAWLASEGVCWYGAERA